MKPTYLVFGGETHLSRQVLPDLEEKEQLLSNINDLEKNGKRVVNFKVKPQKKEPDVRGGKRKESKY